MKAVAEGLQRKAQFNPEPAHLASALGNHGVDVVATTALILYFEIASNDLLMPYYEPDDITVGTHVHVDHLAPAVGSKPVEVSATLTRRQGRRLEFDLSASQDGTVVMRGQHHRALMHRDRFSALPAAGDGAPRSIEFWFDFHSPWCYFAGHQISRIGQEFNAAVHWKPVHLANLNIAVGGRRPLEANENFVFWYEQDMRDTASLLGLPLAPHKNYPCRPSRALRAAIYAQEQGLAAPFVQRLMRGYWSEQMDISDMQLLRQVAAEVGLDGDAMASAAMDHAYKQRLRDHLEQAIERRYFGLPVAWVDGKIFWGNDRLELLREFLAGRLPATPPR